MAKNRNNTKKRAEFAKKLASKAHSKWRFIAIFIVTCVAIVFAYSKIKSEILYSDLFVIEEKMPKTSTPPSVPFI